MEVNKIKVKDLPLRVSVVNKHKKVATFLYILTYIIFFPLVIFQLINDVLENILNLFVPLRTRLVNNIFKIIYKKEIIAKEQELDWKE